MMSRSAAIGLLCLLLGGCELVSGGFEYGSVRVRATDRAGAPVPGVVATLYAPDYLVGSAVTDAEGVAVITQVAARDFALRITAPASHLLLERSDTIFRQRRDTVIHNLRVGAGEDREVQVPLRPVCCGTLRIRAVDPSGAPVPGTIAVPYTTTVAFADTAGADGVAVVSILEEGEYALRVQAPPAFAFATGRDTVVYGVLIREGRETRRDVVIRRAP